MKEHCYSVSFMVHNKNNNAWASKVVWAGTDERTAWAQYGSEMSRLMGSSDFDVVTVYIASDNNGENGYISHTTWDERENILPPPEPEKEPILTS